MNQNFDLKEAKRLYDEGMLKEHLDAKNYIAKYFFPTRTGTHFVWQDNTFAQYTKENLRDAYFNRLPKELGTWYFKETDQLFTVINSLHSPRIDGDTINLCAGFLYKPKPFASYDNETKERVKLMLNFINEIICSNSQESFIYIQKWLATMVKGRKNDSVLYLKGIEGIGKSTFTDFILEFVLGSGIAMISNAEPLVTSYNKILCGKLLVVFEELPTFSNQQWEGVASKMKDNVTGTVSTYTDKYEKSFQAPNINNYVINTNVDAIKHSHGRRYFILDLSAKKLSNFGYFENLRAKCFNKNIGEAFFNYLLEVDTANFNAQGNMPITQKKLDAIAERLDYVYRFVKTYYVIPKKYIKCSLQDLYNEYLGFMVSEEKNPVTKILFRTKLHEVNLDADKIKHGYISYDITYETLKVISDKLNWVHELDEPMMTASKSEEIPYDVGIEHVDFSVKSGPITITPKCFDMKDYCIKTLTEENAQLKAEVAQLKANKPKPNPPKPKKEKISTKIIEEDTTDTVLNLFDV